MSSALPVMLKRSMKRAKMLTLSPKAEMVSDVKRTRKFLLEKSGFCPDWAVVVVPPVWSPAWVVCAGRAYHLPRARHKHEKPGCRVFCNSTTGLFQPVNSKETRLLRLSPSSRLAEILSNQPIEVHPLARARCCCPGHPIHSSCTLRHQAPCPRGVLTSCPATL